MDELPPEAREVLRLARDQHNPHDLAARARVRASLKQAVGAGATRAGLFKSGAWVAGAKVGAALLALGSIAALAAVRRTEAPPAAPTAAAGTHAAAEPPTPAPALPSQPSAELGHDPGEAARVVRVRAAPREAQADTLDVELKLMQRVREALAAGDPRAAGLLLQQHRARFARPLLSEEREGFGAIVACMEQRRDAQAAARAFVARHPRSLLRERVLRACREGDAP